MGKVQGVCFRSFIEAKVKELGGLVGFVQNDPDGSVYMEIQGRRENIMALMIACHLGPEGAKIDKINVYRAEEKNCTGFEVR